MQTIVSANDVAQFILSSKSPLPAFHLHKFLYYCQAWSLVWDGVPLFHEPIEAWANGPVVRELYEKHKGVDNFDFWPYGDMCVLDFKQKYTILSVMNGYSKHTVQELKDQILNEGPWKKARCGLSDAERGNRVISLDSLRKFYTKIYNKNKPKGE